MAAYSGNKGGFVETRPRCVSCHSDSARRLLTRVHPKGGPLDIYRCGMCDLVYLGGWSKTFEQDLYRYYDRHAGAPMEERFSELNTARHIELLAAWGKQVRGRRLLDVGCGEGHLVHSALSQGWDAQGVDLSEGAIAICHSYGLPCRALDFFDPELDREVFDVVVMSEFIEHVPEPQRFLARAGELLAPGGLLYLTTPNHASVTRRLVKEEWYCPEHIAYFTPRTLRELLRSSLPGHRTRVGSRNLSAAALVDRAKPILHGARRVAAALPRRRRRPSLLEQGSHTDRAREEPTSAPNLDQRLRTQLAQSPALRGLKRVANALLSVVAIGDTLVATAQKKVSTR